jgi:magnesium-protoporphyrin IX monomethyl ester (oxidative) cyclase
MNHGRRRVVLVEPPINPITRRFGLPLVANYPPLAQARLAGQIGDDDVEIVDLRIPGETHRMLAGIRRDPPCLVGISLTFTSNGEESLSIARRVREIAPDVPIVLGGSAATEEPDAFLDDPVDLIGFRSGDVALPALVREVRRTRELPSRFPGFFHRDGGRFVLEEGPPAPALSEIRPNAWHLIPRRYWRRYHQGFRLTGMGQTSEGCPFDCSFCSVWITHGRRIRLASLENVKHDLNSLPKMTRGFFFADDIWMQGSEYQIRALYDPLYEWVVSDFARRRTDFMFTVETRTDLYLREEHRFKDWIRHGKLKRIFFGVEAATDEQLQSFSKRNTVDNNSEAIRRAAEAGARVVAQYVVPPDSDRGDFDELARFVRDHRRWVAVTNFTVATPLPGTVLYREVIRDHPELADRSQVRAAAFGLFTALTPTRLEPREFYERLAGLYREANYLRYRPGAAGRIFQGFLRAPWLAGKMIRVPRLLRALQDPRTFLQAHHAVQGDRLMTATTTRGASPRPVSVVPSPDRFA